MTPDFSKEADLVAANFECLSQNGDQEEYGWAVGVIKDALTATYNQGIEDAAKVINHIANDLPDSNAVPYFDLMIAEKAIRNLAKTEGK